jgi:hypothetical protein
MCHLFRLHLFHQLAGKARRRPSAGFRLPGKPIAMPERGMAKYGQGSSGCVNDCSWLAGMLLRGAGEVLGYPGNVLEYPGNVLGYPGNVLGSTMFTHPTTTPCRISAPSNPPFSTSRRTFH